MKPRLIGIGGGTGAGKSTLAQALAVARPDEVTLIEYDWYYRDQQHLAPEARALVNYDHPEALDTEQLVNDLAALLAGQPVLAPVYDFCAHTRASATHPLAPRPLLVLEGIHALGDPRLRTRMALKVFVHCPPPLRLSRRIQRDTQERGRDLSAVLKQYERDVEPMHIQYVEQSRVHADLELRGVVDPDAAAQQILARLDAG
jgi:uridine kinase